jgi:hypothetical protein
VKGLSRALRPSIVVAALALSACATDLRGTPVRLDGQDLPQQVLELYRATAAARDEVTLETQDRWFRPPFLTERLRVLRTMGDEQGEGLRMERDAQPILSLMVVRDRAEFDANGVNRDWRTRRRLFWGVLTELEERGAKDAHGTPRREESSFRLLGWLFQSNDFRHWDADAEPRRWKSEYEVLGGLLFGSVTRGFRDARGASREGTGTLVLTGLRGWGSTPDDDGWLQLLWVRF